MISKTQFFNWLLLLSSYFFALLDWFNGTRIDLRDQTLHIRARYRFQTFEVVLPYEFGKGAYIGKRKGKPVELKLLPGLGLYVSAEKLGCDEIIEPPTD